MLKNGVSSPVIRARCQDERPLKRLDINFNIRSANGTRNVDCISKIYLYGNGNSVVAKLETSFGSTNMSNREIVLEAGEEVVGIYGTRKTH